MIYRELNQSFCIVETSDFNIKKKISERFSIPITNAYFNPLVQAGIKDDKERFYKINPKNPNQLMVPIGLRDFLRDLVDIPEIKPEFTDEYIQEHIDEVKPFEPYDYQREAILGAIKNQKHFIRAATGSGKSLIIALIADFLVDNDYKGLILVPSISLVEQFNSDLRDYKVNVYKHLHLIGGNHKEKHFDNPLTISTYQSVMRFKDSLDKLDFIIVDEAHTAKANEVFDIVSRCTNAIYKIGLSGTLPEDPVDVMRILSCFGKPKTYITTQGLINRGLATPVNINILKLNYNTKIQGDYTKQLKFLKEYSPRTDLIVSLTSKLKGNTLVLFQHTEHGKEIFRRLYLNKGLEVRERDITGKNALVMQSVHKIYFINGSVDSENRETIRKILDKQDQAIIIGNYKCTSTGINMKKLHNMVLASPLKSYVTITQSIGRGVRLHNSKQIFNLYDIADNIGMFRPQLKHRILKSYNPEGFPIKEVEIKI